MNKENYNELFSFDSGITGDGKINIPAEKSELLKRKGIDKIRVSVFVDSKKLAEKSGVEPELFDLIQTTQSIPAEVVADFFESKGSLKGTGFSERIKY